MLLLKKKGTDLFWWFIDTVILMANSVRFFLFNHRTAKSQFLDISASVCKDIIGSISFLKMK